MIFYVKEANGTLIGKFDMAGNTLLRDAKLEIQRRTGIPVQEQRFVYQGRELENQRTFNDYNIQDNAVLYFISRLRGG